MPAKLLDDASIYLGGASDGAGPDQRLLLRYGNRHGFVTGATGTGKTVTLQVLAESFSEMGVPVFAADIKGDLSGIAAKGEPKPPLVERARTLGFEEYEQTFSAFPVVFWDLFGEQGHPIRTTVSEMGPLLLARILNLNETQEGVLNIIFEYADKAGLLLLDLKDLREVIAQVGASKELMQQLRARYGNVNSASVGAIQRQLLILEQQGGDRFFGEPALELSDLMRRSRDQRGVVNILAADRLMQSPRLYATFLLWLLSELFEHLPEVGDPERPKLVFFFDEAHLLFEDAPDALVAKVEQVVRLVRSKGVGVYFVTQNPADLPDKVSAQLGNRVQHALRAFTPREQRSVRAAADTFRPNPRLPDLPRVIQDLGTGEALVSVLEGRGTPGLVERTLVRPPSGRIGPVTPEERQRIVGGSALAGKYDEVVDRESAYEKLTQRAADPSAPPARAPEQPASQRPAEPQAPSPWGRQAAEPRLPQPPQQPPSGYQPASYPQPYQPQQPPPAPSQGGGFLGGVLGTIFGTGGEEVGPRGGRVRGRQTIGEAVIKSAARSASSTVGRQVANVIVRGVLGSIIGRRR